MGRNLSICLSLDSPTIHTSLIFNAEIPFPYTSTQNTATIDAGVLEVAAEDGAHSDSDAAYFKGTDSTPATTATSASTPLSREDHVSKIDPMQLDTDGATPSSQYNGNSVASSSASASSSRPRPPGPGHLRHRSGSSSARFKRSVGRDNELNFDQRLPRLPEGRQMVEVVDDRVETEKNEQGECLVAISDALVDLTAMTILMREEISSHHTSMVRCEEFSAGSC